MYNYSHYCVLRSVSLVVPDKRTACLQCEPAISQAGLCLLNQLFLNPCRVNKLGERARVKIDT